MSSRRDKLEQIKLLQRVRKRAAGTSADALARVHAAGATDGVGDDDEEPAVAVQRPLELMGTFSKEKTVATSEEDPHM